jgi:hypothetical protein
MPLDILWERLTSRQYGIRRDLDISSESRNTADVVCPIYGSIGEIIHGWSIPVIGDAMMGEK